MGAGTTGLVFRAHDPVEGRLVAIKAFRVDLTPERAAELAHALQALAARHLSHPSIAAPIAAGVEDGIAWFAQAYVPAESLDSAMRQYGPPPVADALTIVTQLAGALDFAAATGVLHGSLHPRDVLVAPGETHLVDLGVAGALEACGVRAPVRRPYSAPERSAGRPLSRAGDIFALGAIAFELLSGQPVTGAGDDVIITLPDLPGSNREALLETFSFALALAPDERYATALAFASPLKRALGDALTRPAVPRKRRTTRPPETLLPIGGLESEPPAEAPTAAVPVVERPADPTAYDIPERFTAGPPSSYDTPRISVAPEQSDEIEPTVRTRPTPRVARDAARGESIDGAAPAYLSGPTEPEPAAPAIEPIAAPGEADPMGADDFDVRHAPLDAGDSRSALDAVELNGPAEPIDRWAVSGKSRPNGPSRAARDGIGHPDLHDTLGPDPDDADPEATAYAAPPYEAYEPHAGDYGNVDGAVLDDTVAPARAPWLTLAAMLLVGLVAGLAGGWFLFGGRSERSSSPGAAPAAAAAADAGGARAREWTDDSVRQPGGTTSAGTPSAARPAPAPRVPDEPRAAPASSATATAPRTEAAARGRLVVRTRPAGARVEIGGRPRGESPATVSDLAYGQHVVRVSRQGYVTEQRRVTLSARLPAQTVDVTLKPTQPPAPARAARETNRFVGTVVVESRPVGAKVFLDGKGLGVTPLSVPDVAVGSHVVRLEMSGYRRWSASIRVVAGERERVAASLEEETVR